MNPILLLMGLLVLSYLGSFLVGGRARAGAGSASGIEYVALGFALGPHALGILGRDLLGAFEPLVEVALGWLALVIGLDFGRTGERRAHAGTMILGLLGGAFTGAASFAAVWLWTARVRPLPPGIDRVLLAGGIGAACAETTRHALRWAVERLGANGALTTRLGDFAHADDLVPLAATAYLFSRAPMAPLPIRVSLAGWVGVTIGLGLVLGAMTAMHIGRELRTDQTWGVLLGMSVLGVGVAVRLGLSVLAVLFFMGFATAGLSRHRAALRAMVAPVERPILLPALVLAGAHVDLRAMPGLGWIVALAIAARVLSKLLFGLVLRVRSAAGAGLGAGLLSSGALTMCIGLAYAVRFPGPLGDAVLVTAAACCVFGELVGPPTLRRILRDAGEIQDAPIAAGDRALADDVAQQQPEQP